jgi:hypothetical protein
MIEQALNSENLTALSGKSSAISKPSVLSGADKLEFLQRRIHEDDYLHAAIQRLALVLSNELMEISMQGGHHERKRRK